jgi:two-component system sensor histidine kinase KdpD
MDCSGGYNSPMARDGSTLDALKPREREPDPRKLTPARSEPAAAEKATRRFVPDWKGYVVAIAVVVATTALGWPLYHKLGLHDTNILMLYLLGVLWIATHHSRAAAILASVLAVLAFDFTFVLPYYRLTVDDQQYLVTFSVMLVTALTISTLTYHVRLREKEAREAWERVEVEFLRNTLLSGVSHELRTPLAAITGASSTLIEAGDHLSPQAKTEMLDTVFSEAERMERLINNLLDITRMESGGLVLKKEWQPLEAVIGSALHHLDRRLRGREVRTRVPADLPLVEIDAIAVEQVLINLIDNAVQYTPEGSAVEISAQAGDGEVIVEVADHGPGLPPGTEDRVFDKFFRIRPLESRRGTGLGLAIARGIVQVHGGQISAMNRPGGGALFRFTLPLGGTPPVVDASA